MSETDPLREIDTISNADRQAMLRAWKQAWEEKKDNVVDYEEAKRVLDARSISDAAPADLEGEVPGSFTFGDNVPFYFTVLEHIIGKSAALESLVHELEHRKVFQKYKVPTEFGFVISRKDGQHFLVPVITPCFPDTMMKEERVAIFKESYDSHPDPSEGDLKAMNLLSPQGRS